MANITVPIQVNLPDDWVEQIIERMRNDPTAEWIEVIRCKDCKHLYQDNGCPLRTWWTHTEDDFCSYAERRTDDQQRNIL